VALRFLAVADDLSGAHDCAARWAEFLGPVPTAREAAALRLPGGEKTPGALVLDAETRFLKPAEARWRSARAWQALHQAASAPLRFQKIDSTLRGNPGKDIEGMALATAAAWVAVVAAHPHAGRQTLNGTHRVHGVPLQSSEYARDPVSPAAVAGPPELFPDHLRLQVPLARVKQGAARLAAFLRAALKKRAWRFVTFDCETVADLECIVAACLAAGCRHFAGSAAFAGSLAKRQMPKPLPMVPPPRGLAWIGLIGSVSGQSFVQLRQAEASGVVQWFALSEPASISRLRQAFRRGPLVLSTLAGREALPRALSRRQARSAGEAALQRLVHVGRSVAGRQAGWLLAGGHTALRFFEAAGLARFDVHGEILPGVAFGQALGFKQQAWVATKPGGFGQADLLSRFFEQVQAR
jgi:uncharacterized protein YgbK (DUF1537 family)